MRRTWTRAAVAGLAAVLAAPVGLVLAAPAAEAATSLAFAGHGWGHGRGLSQWGSYGYAVDRGWSSARILDHYYGGTTAGTVADDEISVKITALDAQNTIVLTAGQAFNVEGQVVAAGSGAKFVRSGARWTLTTTTAGCTGTDTSTAVDVGTAPAVWLPTDPGDDASKMLTVCNTGKTYRGNFRPVVDAAGVSHLVNHVRLESYLRGVVPSESPASWGDAGGGKGMAALEAQAVAARSYGRSEGRWSYAQSCDTDSCQVYGGVAKEDARTDRAIGGTRGTVRRDARGAVVRTEFSSSTGGWTAGGAFPAVEDAGDTRSPRHDWTTTVPTSRISAAWPQIGTFSAMTVLARNGLGADGGRVTSVRISGTSGSVTVTGNAVRSALGLFSDWFTPTRPTETAWMLRGTTTGGDPEAVVRFGGPDDKTLTCDFDADGKDGIVVYRGGRWDLRHTASPGRPDASFTYGTASMVPVCGDWDGDGRDGIGAYEPSTGRWYLRNSPSAGPADAVVQYGWSAATPVVGDWNGDGRDTLGVYAAGRWMLRNDNSSGAPDVDVQYGWAAATPVPGDWTGSGTTTLGVWSAGRWLLRTSLTPGAPDRTVDYGTDGDVPISGVWGQTRAQGVGITRPVL